MDRVPVIDGGLGQPALLMQVVFVLGTQTLQRGRLLPLRRRRTRRPGLDEMIDEPARAELGVIAMTASNPAQDRVPEALSGRNIEIADPKAAFLDRVAKPAGYRPVFLDRDCSVALRGEPFQEGFAMRPRPSRLISPFVVRIPRQCHLPLLPSWRKARRLGLEDRIVSESEALRSSRPG